MKLSPIMVDTLHQICEIEPAKKTRRLNVPVTDLGVRMIQLYYDTRNVLTRELIMSFMQHAGFHWVRKLVTRDTSPMLHVVMASIDDYVNIMPANEPGDFQAAQ